MQFPEDNKRSDVKKLAPQARYPKKLPSYVVAFSLKETYDDLITAQQMICYKKSPQESNNSITPTNSLKMFDTEQSNKLNQILDKPITETSEESNKTPSLDNIILKESMTLTSSMKYLSSDNVSDASLITIGKRDDISATGFNTDIEEIKKTCEAFEYTEDKGYIHFYDSVESLTNKLSKTDKNLTNENKIEDTKQNPKNINQVLKMEPKPIFKTSKQGSHKYKKKKSLKRKPNRTVNVKQNNFKYRNPNKFIEDRLEKYYEKRNLIDAEQIQKELYSEEVSTVVSRTRVLQKNKARENTLEESQFFTFINDVGLNEYDKDSLSSSVSTIKKSVDDNSSQNTLTQKCSNTSVEENENSKTVNSVVRMTKDNAPYKTDVINVAIAVAYNKSKVNIRDDTGNVSSNKKFMNLESLTSSEMVTPCIANIIPDITSSYSEDFNSVTIETSDETLVNKNSSFGISSDDFVIARTSSDFTKTSSNDSTFTLKNNVETVVDIEPDAARPVQETKPTLLETVINLGIYPEMTPSTSSDTPYEYSYNDVIVAKNLNNAYAINSNKGDNKEQDLSPNVLRKSINHQKEKTMNKTINIPNQAEIKALLKENNVPQFKCAEEARHPSYLPEMWDRLVMTLEVAVKRLEDSLIEKIRKELKAVLGQTYIPDKPASTKAETSKPEKVDTDQGQQCDLVKNTIIDQIMQKLSTEGPKLMDPAFAMKTLQNSKLFKDFEVLKSPDLDKMMLDTVTVSTFTYEMCNFRRLKTLIAAPVNFIRENVLVITSVPMFLVVLLCVYGMIVFFMKPW